MCLLFNSNLALILRYKLSIGTPFITIEKTKVFIKCFWQKFFRLNIHRLMKLIITDVILKPNNITLFSGKLFKGFPYIYFTERGNRTEAVNLSVDPFWIFLVNFPWFDQVWYCDILTLTLYTRHLFFGPYFGQPSYDLNI